MLKPHSLLSDAKSAQRLKAGLVDLFLFSIVFSVVKTISHAIFSADPGAVFHFIISILYYAVPQHLTGQTIGKRLFDLKVIADNSDARIGILKSILRETFAKYISSLFLLLGYLSILFREDRRAWHDLICKTRVVSLTQEHEETSFLQMLLTSAGAVSVIGAIGLYVLLYTSYPLKQFAKNLEQSNIEVNGIHGSLLKGFGADRISYSDKSAHAELTNFKLKYKSLYWALKSEKFEFEDISADSITIKVSQSYIDEFQKPSSPNTAEKKTAQKKEIIFRSVLVDQLSFKNIDFQSPKLNFKVSEVEMKGLNFSEDKTLLTSLSAVSEDFNVMVADVHIEQNTRAFGFQIQGELAPSWSRKILKKVDFSGVVDGVDKKITHVNLAAFENKLRVYDSVGSKFVLSMNSFSPSEFVSTAIRIRQINSFQVFDQPEEILKNLNLTGSVEFNHIRFAFLQNSPLKAAGSRGNENFELAIESMSLFSLIGITDAPEIKLTSSLASKAEDHLPRFYFSKNFASLNQEEKMFIDHQARRPASAK